MNKIILIGLFLFVITVEPKSIQREKVAGNAEQRASQVDQGAATLESRDKNGEEHVQKLQTLQKMMQIRQANSVPNYFVKPEECTNCTENCTCDELRKQAKDKLTVYKETFPDEPNYRCEVHACDCTARCFSLDPNASFTDWKKDYCRKYPNENRCQKGGEWAKSG